MKTKTMKTMMALVMLIALSSLAFGQEGKPCDKTTKATCAASKTCSSTTQASTPSSCTDSKTANKASCATTCPAMAKGQCKETKACCAAKSSCSSKTASQDCDKAKAAAAGDCSKGGVKTASTHAQETCPIMGGKINKNVYVDYHGKRIYACCEGCLPKIKADPEKYIKQLEEKGVELEKVQPATKA